MTHDITKRLKWLQTCNNCIFRQRGNDELSSLIEYAIFQRCRYRATDWTKRIIDPKSLVGLPRIKIKIMASLKFNDCRRRIWADV